MKEIVFLLFAGLGLIVIQGIFWCFKYRYSCPQCGCWGSTTERQSISKCEAGAGGDRPFVDLLQECICVRRCANPDCDHVFTKERKW